jgi:hypothetical protein
VPEGAGRARCTRLLALVGLVAALAVVLSGCGSAESGGDAGNTETQNAAMPSAATRTSEGGEVTVEVVWKGASAGPVFEVTIDTHSVDLDGYDFRELAVLRDDRRVKVRPTVWDAPKGGHHREGTLSFPPKDENGELVIGPDARRIELVIRDVAGVPERRFEWRT